MPYINLLPWRQLNQEKREQQRQLTILSLMALLASIAFLGRLYLVHLGEMQRHFNAALQDRIVRANHRIGEKNTFQKNEEVLLARLHTVDKLQASGSAMTHLFDELIKVIPTDGYITRLARKGNTLFIWGGARRKETVVNFLHNLANNCWILKPRLIRLERSPLKTAVANRFKLQAYNLGENRCENG